MSTLKPFLPVIDLRKILADNRLRDDDQVATRTQADTGNLPILRNGRMVGLIEVSPVTGDPSSLVMDENVPDDTPGEAPAR